MLRKFVALGVLTLAGVALCAPDPSFARGGGGGGFGGFRGGGFRGPVAIHRAPFMSRTGAAALGRNGAAFRPVRSTLPPPVARHLPVNPNLRPVTTHIGKPFAHLARHNNGHHRRFLDGYGGYVYPYTTWDDGSYAGSYVGVPYDPGAAIPVYGPAPALDSASPPPVPRIGMRDYGGEACRAERVTVPGDKDDREITVVRC